MTKFTVYIPSHNYGRYLEQAVESVLRQSVGDWELLLFDDGSTDNTAEVMQLYRGDPRVRLFSTPGIGLAAVANRALQEARGDYIIRLDADDIFDENILLVLGHHLDQHPEIALVFPDYYLFDEHGEIFAQERKEKVYWNQRLLGLPPNGACTMVRVAALKAIGGYREGIGAQDGFDIWTRLGRKYRAANVNIPLFYYRRHDRNLTGDTERILAARRQIKAQAMEAEWAGHRPITAVIPCRRNYDFVPDVWNEQIAGRSLLARAIECCAASSLFDHIVVTSDNPATREAMAAHSDPRLRFVERTPEETLRSQSLVPTLQRIAAELDLGEESLMLLSYVQAPLTHTATLEEALATLVLNEADSTMAVFEVGGALFRRSAQGLEPVNRRGLLSSEYDVVYCEANIALTLRVRNLRSNRLLGARTAHFEIAHDEVLFIDAKRKLEIARILLRETEAS